MSNQLPVTYWDIAEERQLQHKKWGTQRHDFAVWITVLAEEVGELSQEVLRYRYVNTLMLQDGVLGRTALQKMREEAVQVAAVAVAMIEHIDEEREHADA